MMAGHKRERVEEVFSAALEREPGERAAYVAHTCGNDAELRHEVESLLGWARDRSLVERGRVEELVEAVQEEATELKAGDKIGRYQVLGKIGEGGMGEVYLARDTRLGRRVALKLLPVSSMLSQDRLRRFEQEAYAASNLNHPNIVTIYEIAQEGATHFIATEYIEGETLREHMSKKSMKLAEALDISVQIAAALAAAHQAEVVHRDIKPENVMLRPDGIVKVMDFGLAKLSRMLTPDHGDEKEAPTRLIVKTMPGVVMGTIGYMSPEQAQGKAVDLRSDIFSFGCILFEATTGHKLFEGDSAIDSLHKTVHAPAPPIRDFNPEAPPELQRIVRRCLAKETERRYQSIKDVAIELDELRQELKSTAQDSLTPKSSPPALDSARSKTSNSLAVSSAEAARPISSAEFLAGGIQRHKTAVLATLGVILVVIAAGAYGLYRLVSSKKTSTHFEKTKMAKLTTLGNVNEVAISPDGKFISYTLLENDKQSLWSKYLPTGSVVQIVAPANFRYLENISFSPDGNFVYYNAWNDKYPKGALLQTPVLGGTPKEIMEGSFTPVSFSPTGKQFTFGRFTLNSNIFDVCVADIDGTNIKTLATRLESGGEWFATNPAWSPDGKLLAIGLGSSEGVHKTTLVAIAVDSGKVTPLTSEVWNDLNLVAWRSDGSAIMVTGSSYNEPGDQIFEISYPGGETRRITNGFNLFLNFGLTADGQKIAATYKEDVCDIWVVPVD
ncbi:MAG TPA: protein kinase, partial [Candidatus Binatia bacterium]|nr:protein kinase [Candidatus Binatia bacterium]